MISRDIKDAFDSFRKAYHIKIAQKKGLEITSRDIDFSKSDRKIQSAIDFKIKLKKMFKKFFGG